MLSRIKSFLEKNLPFLFKETMPVWLTILVSISAAVATYVFAPAYNRQFAIEDVRSAHLTKTTDQLNSDMIELSQSIRRLNSSFANNDGKSAEIRESTLDVITKIQWRLVDIRVILSSESDKKLVKRYADDLSNLKKQIDSPGDQQYPNRILGAMSHLAESTQSVLNRLYLRASIKE